MVREIAGLLRGMLDDSTRYKVQGRAGQPNLRWSETPFTAVMDRLVTDSPKRGHYIVYLVHSSGSGVWLSLMQGIEEMRRTYRGAYAAALESRARAVADTLDPAQTIDLKIGRIDLNGAGARTRGYESGSIVARWYPKDAMPHDSVLASHLYQFLGLYDVVTEQIDDDAMAADEDAPVEAKEGTESRRYRWHLRAEGRNRSVVRAAKRIQGSICRVCERDFAAAFADLGKRCIDAHHLAPFSELDESPRRLHPVKDFAIVCANCHRMLHSETPPLEPDVLRKRLQLGTVAQ